MIVALGIAQVISWGTLFYAIGVLGPAMRADLQVSEVFLFGSFTAGLLVSGTLAPFVGRTVDERGGRVALSAGSVLAIVALMLLATSMHPAQLVAGWLLAGAAMAACLYDSAFATLSQHTGTRYRTAVTVLTLFGGFASTVFWPLSYILMQAWGWRVTLAVYAGFHLFLCLPIHLLFIPKKFGITHAKPAASEAIASPVVSSASFRWLMASFAIATFIFSVFAVHILTILTVAGLTPAQAVSLSILVGPMQVVGRVFELGFSKRVRAVTMGMASFALLLLALFSLLTMNGAGLAALVFVTAYGCGNGLLTIVRGIAPAELFGREGLGKVIGYLSRASLYSRALAPACFSAMLAIGLSHYSSLLALTVLAVIAFLSYAIATRSARRVKA
jgi:hypothetical protein